MAQPWSSCGIVLEQFWNSYGAVIDCLGATHLYTSCLHYTTIWKCYASGVEYTQLSQTLYTTVTHEVQLVYTIDNYCQYYTTIWDVGKSCV